MRIDPPGAVVAAIKKQPTCHEAPVMRGIVAIDEHVMKIGKKILVRGGHFGHGVTLKQQVVKFDRVCSTLSAEVALISLSHFPSGRLAACLFGR
jgi:hypothetical protein